MMCPYMREENESTAVNYGELLNMTKLAIKEARFLSGVVTSASLLSAERFKQRESFGALTLLCVDLRIRRRPLWQINVLCTVYACICLQKCPSIVKYVPDSLLHSPRSTENETAHQRPAFGKWQVLELNKSVERHLV